MPEKKIRPKFGYHITPPGSKLSSPMPASPCPMESSKQSVQKKPISWMPHGVPLLLAIPSKKFSLSTCPASKSVARSSMKPTELSLENPTSHSIAILMILTPCTRKFFMWNEMTYMFKSFFERSVKRIRQMSFLLKANFLRVGARSSPTFLSKKCFFLFVYFS